MSKKSSKVKVKDDDGEKIDTPTLKPSPIHRMLTEEKRQTSLSTIVDKEACGEYILIDIIGKGGFGVVYKGLHSTKGYFSAIKKIKITKKKKGDQQQQESQSQLMVEINLLKVLSHHNIVRYYDHISSPSHSYIVMEFIENGSLEKMIKRHGLLPESLVNVYIVQVLNGLEYLHRQGVIHRDIKAANLLISTDGSIKLADFGVATKVSDLSADNPDDSFAGTPYWMAPEVIQMQGVSTACDVWSLGCTIIELLTGTPPYFGLAPAAALYKIVQEDHPPMPQGISERLKDFLLQCFKKDENMRSSAKQLLLHPWIKAVALMNNPVVKNATMEILTYNAQLQEGIVTPQGNSPNQQDIINRPRSKQGPLPTPSPKNNNNSSWIPHNTLDKNHHSSVASSNSNLQLGSPRSPTLKQVPTSTSSSTTTTSTGSTSTTPHKPLTLQPLLINKSTNPTTDTSSIPNTPRKEDKALQLKNHLSKYVDDDEDDDDMMMMEKPKPIKQKLSKYVEENDEDDSDFFRSVNTPPSIMKPLQQKEEDIFDGFSDEEIEKPIPKATNKKPNQQLKLKVKDTMDEWDSEIEDSFDSLNAEDDDTQRTINLHDKQKEQVTLTIVDLLSQLKPLANRLSKPAEGNVTGGGLNCSMNGLSLSDSGSGSTQSDPANIIDRLSELFQRFPEEKRLLINNGEGGVYFRLPLITMLEILEIEDVSCSLVLAILKLINQCLSVVDHQVNNVLLETICILNGIPIITIYARRQYDESIREQVSKFVHRLCVSSSYSLNMFIAGSRGCKVLVDLVDSDYFHSSTLIHNTLDSISQIFKMTTALPKTSLCHLFSQTLLLPRLSHLLYQIFITSDQDTQQQIDQKIKIKNNIENNNNQNNNNINININNMKLKRGSSVQMLPKDSFDRVLSYSVKVADIMLFFSTGDSLVKEEMCCETVLRPITEVLQEIHTWSSIASDVRSFLLRMLKVIKNLSMDQANRSKLDEVNIIPTLINYLGYHQSGIEKISEIYNQILHSLYYLLLLDKSRQDKALKNGILAPLLFIINERGPLKELALPILFDFVRLTSSSSRALLWQCETLDKLLVLLEDRNWFADAIESIAAWAVLEPIPVYQRLQQGSSCQALLGILHSSHVRHPSFPKALIPLLQLMTGSSTLIGQLVSVGLVSHLVECLDIDTSPVSKITLLKIVSTVKHSAHFSTIDGQQLTKLIATLTHISKHDESDIVKKISEDLT